MRAVLLAPVFAVASLLPTRAAAQVMPPAGAAESPALDCANAVTQLDMTRCAGRELAEADRELHGVHAALRRSLPARQATALRDVQRAWITFKDRQCRLEGSAYAGGSLQGLIVTNCLTRETRRRTDALRALQKALKPA